MTEKPKYNEGFNKIRNTLLGGILGGIVGGIIMSGSWAFERALQGPAMFIGAHEGARRGYNKGSKKK